MTTHGASAVRARWCIASAGLCLACGGDAPLASTPRSGSPPSVSTVRIEPRMAALFTRTSSEMRATAADSSGRPITVEFRWEVSDPTVVSVTPTSESGLAFVRGLEAGEVTITATSGGKAGSSIVRVAPSLDDDDVRISSGTPTRPHEEEPSLAIGPAGDLLAGWQHFLFPCCVLFSKSASAGQGWTTAVEMRPHRSDVASGQTLSQKDPWLATDASGAVYFSWLENVVHLDDDRNVVVDTSLVLVARSDDDGNSWNDAVNVQTVPGGVAADKPSIASDGSGVLYAGYTLHLSEEESSILVTRSLDRGVTWSTPVEIARGVGIISHVATGPSGLVCAAWADFGGGAPSGNLIQVSCSRDRGVAWDTRTVGTAYLDLDDVESGEHRFRGAGPVMGIAPDAGLFVVWVDEEWNVTLARSVDGGTTWSDPAALNDVSIGRRWQPHVAVGPGGHVHATWYDERMGPIHVVHTTSTDGGETWSPNLRISSQPTPVGRSEPDRTRLGDYMGLAVRADGALHILWTDWRSPEGQDIFAALVP